MQINGLLVTLSAGPAGERRRLLRRLAARRELSLGALNDRWLPVAMEARDDAHARELHDWIGALPGVEFVDVVSVNFAELEERGCAEGQPQPVEPGKMPRRVEYDTAALLPHPR